MIDKIKELSMYDLGLPHYFDKLKGLLFYEKSNEWRIDHNLVLGYNELTKKSWEEIKLIVAHELMHLALLHPFIKESEHLHLLQKACDYVVNGMLINEYGLIKLVKYAAYIPDSDWKIKVKNKKISIKGLTHIELFARLCNLENKNPFEVKFMLPEMASFLFKCRGIALPV